MYKRRSILRALVAGAAAGLAASWALGQTHGLVLRLIGAENSQQTSEDPTVIVARAIARPILRRDFNASEKKIAGSIVHYAFGASMATAYSVAAEFFPPITFGKGVPFGAALWVGAHVIAVPAFGLAPPITHSKTSSETAEFVAHLSYGAVTELIRAPLRSLLD
ncbi:MAG: DUF1440 domain-containing protein [Acidobacteriaceae bacterium]|nr:DUF1440 domain-containing protein [Acidobacteriaceae bacterium]MBV9296711.1 DUF1440 domain-containing protein [Acidobacteriaceae bacterium]MBV9767438.1 DUF1440 domain-containing protein [Acidobacteriaceae bacterium]